jgi:hypothetical protein
MTDHSTATTEAHRRLVALETIGVRGRVLGIAPSLGPDEAWVEGPTGRAVALLSEPESKLVRPDWVIRLMDDAQASSDRRLEWAAFDELLGDPGQRGRVSYRTVEPYVVRDGVNPVTRRAVDGVEAGAIAFKLGAERAGDAALRWFGQSGRVASKAVGATFTGGTKLGTAFGMVLSAVAAVASLDPVLCERIPRGDGWDVLVEVCRWDAAPRRL